MPRDDGPWSRRAWFEIAVESQAAVEPHDSESWWWERFDVSCAGFADEEDESGDEEDMSESVRSYWDVEVLKEEPVKKKIREPKKRSVEDEFPTEELDEEELAQLGRALLKAGEGVEARARATRHFFATRVPKPPPPAKPESPKRMLWLKPGSSAFMARLRAKQEALSMDRRNLAARQAKRASFLTADKTLPDAKNREKISRKKLEDFKMKRAVITPKKTHSRNASATRLSKQQQQLQTQQIHEVSDDDSDEDEVETCAAVDLHWKVQAAAAAAAASDDDDDDDYRDSF